MIPLLAVLVAALGAVLIAVGLAGLPGTAEAQRNISLLTWNIPIYKEKIEGWVADFKKIHPDVQVEWLDKKGPDWGPFYQTQLVAGTAPDVIDVQGGLWLEYAANNGLVDLGPYLTRDPELKDYYNARILPSWNYEGRQYMVPF